MEEDIDAESGKAESKREDGPCRLKEQQVNENAKAGTIAGADPGDTTAGSFNSTAQADSDLQRELTLTPLFRTA